MSPQIAKNLVAKPFTHMWAASNGKWDSHRQKANLIVAGSLAVTMLGLAAWEGIETWCGRVVKAERIAANLKSFRDYPEQTNLTYVALPGAKLHYGAGDHDYKRVAKGRVFWAILGQKAVIGKDTWIGVLDEGQSKSPKIPTSPKERAQQTYWLDITAGQRDGSIHELTRDRGVPESDVSIRILQNGQPQQVDTDVHHPLPDRFAASSVWLDSADAARIENAA